MNYDYSKLCGRIKERFSTQALFAEALHIGESTLSLKLNNKAEWTQDEMTKAMILLGVDCVDVKDYFFTHSV